jgi:hypothetical protein
MTYSPDELDDFIAAWRDAFGETLSADEANVEASRVVRFYLFLSSGPPPSHQPTPTSTDELLPLLPKIE